MPEPSNPSETLVGSHISKTTTSGRGDFSRSDNWRIHHVHRIAKESQNRVIVLTGIRCCLTVEHVEPYIPKVSRDNAWLCRLNLRALPRLMNVENPYKPTPHVDLERTTLPTQVGGSMSPAIRIVSVVGSGIGCSGAVVYSFYAFNRFDFLWTAISLACGSAMFLIGVFFLRR